MTPQPVTLVREGERGPVEATIYHDGGVSIAGPEGRGFEGPEVYLAADEFRWLILTAGPALLCALPDLEEDAGTGGGPAPAKGEATEATDEPPTVDAGPDLFDGLPDDRADPHTVPCPSCKSPRGAACLTPGGMVARTHAARRRLVER